MDSTLQTIALTSSQAAAKYFRELERNYKPNHDGTFEEWSLWYYKNLTKFDTSTLKWNLKEFDEFLSDAYDELIQVTKEELHTRNEFTFTG